MSAGIVLVIGKWMVSEQRIFFRFTRWDRAVFIGVVVDKKLLLDPSVHCIAGIGS